MQILLGLKVILPKEVDGIHCKWLLKPESQKLLLNWKATDEERNCIEVAQPTTKKILHFLFKADTLCRCW